MLKLRFLKLVSQTTFHGIVKLFNSEHILQRLGWLIVILSSYSYCSIYILSIVTGYLEYQVVTNIKTVYENHPLFPAVTICYAIPLYCRFNGNDCEYSSIQQTTVDCFSINRGLNTTSMHPIQIYKSKESGLLYGLQIDLAKKYNGVDIHVLIHNQSIYYDLKKPIRISSFMETTLIVNRIFENKLGEPYSNCKKDLEFNIIGPEAVSNQTIYPYYQSQCFITCRYQKVAEACNKTNDYMENSQYYYSNLKYFFEFYENLLKNCSNKKIDLANKRFQTEGENLICNCPAECNSIRYSVSPFYLYNNLYSNPRVNIYYEVFDYTLITQLPKIGADSLFGSIGGILGLFLGTSVLSFFEIIDMLYCLITVIIKRTISQHKK